MGKAVKKQTRITIDVSRSEHKKLKLASTLIGISMKELITRSVQEYLTKKNLSNHRKLEALVEENG